ncbi:hypothetical protein AVEN_2276-1 [Araneus ventricosus]|uniref:Uncharacterized protein n=1 Tax=Araneus ventricosus TaxID=182803 RepID=A0A4Y2FNU4_ARAVE|nr:hypothetical protein AVEN_2276-1 [Araneus ventricosus]
MNIQIKGKSHLEITKHGVKKQIRWNALQFGHQTFIHLLQGSGGLVVKSQLFWLEGFRFETRFQKRYPYMSTGRFVEYPSCVCLYTFNQTQQVKLALAAWCGSLESGVQLGCRPHHLIIVQKYEVRPKMAHLLFQNGKLN